MSKKTDTAVVEGQDGFDKKKIESKYHPSLLRECIFNGMDASEIMVKMDVKHRQTLKQYVLKLMSDDKTYYEVRAFISRIRGEPR